MIAKGCFVSDVFTNTVASSSGSSSFGSRQRVNSFCSDCAPAMKSNTVAFLWLTKSLTPPRHTFRAYCFARSSIVFINQLILITMFPKSSSNLRATSSISSLLSKSAYVTQIPKKVRFWIVYHPVSSIFSIRPHRYVFIIISRFCENLAIS